VINRVWEGRSTKAPCRTASAAPRGNTFVEMYSSGWASRSTSDAGRHSVLPATRNSAACPDTATGSGQSMNTCSPSAPRMTIGALASPTFSMTSTRSA
jgi:hypothetical protein